MAVNLSGYWQVDSIDLWDGFKTGILKGTADFLKYAPAKEGIVYNWQGENGIDVDLTAPKFDARTISLQCITITNNRGEFHDNHDALITQLMAPGLHAFRVASHGLTRFYSVRFVRCDNYQPVKALRINADVFNVHQFTLTLLEPMPEIGQSSNRIIDETGRFIVT